MKKISLALAGLLISLIIPATTSADVNNFSVTDFTATETLSRADPQGELHVVEHIKVLYTDNNHGILRAIPDSYKGHSLQLHINSVSSDTSAPSQYTTYDSGNNTVLKIGDPNQTVTGAQEYNIDYTLRNVISFYPDHDELYWDVNGDQWSQPFDAVKVNLTLPSGVIQNRTPVCYAGSFGSTAQSCTITTTDSTVNATTTTALQPNQTLTYVVGFSTGFFTPTTWHDTVSQFIGAVLEFLAPIIIIGSGAAYMWFKRGRDAKGTGIIVPQYGPPDNLIPMEVGIINDFKLEGVEITATIIDLAIRGYIKIIESKQVRKLLKDKLTYSLQLVNADISQLNPQEISVLSAILPDATVGTIVDISTLQHKLYTFTDPLRKDVEAGLTQRGYFRANPLKAGKSLSVVATIGFIVVYVSFKDFFKTASGKILPVLLGFGIGALIAFIFSKFMSARTTQGVAAEEHIKGLKMYLEVAEKDRLEKLQGPDAAYAANSAEPVKTVDLFEKLLPYAMVLGVEKQWGEQFQGLYTSPPGWYSGNWTTFNAVYLTSQLNAGIGSALNTAFTPPSNSGSSGFGGGGFSGGGGGGGGGGGW